MGIEINLCPNCSHKNRIGVLVCENCGKSIFDDSYNVTRIVTGNLFNTRSIVPDEADRPPPANSVLMYIRGAETPLAFNPDKPLILGRINAGNPRRPDIDLTVYRAFELGVSCRHATIYRQDHGLVISDMGSTNGTIVNSYRLTPHQPYILRDGDEIRFGNLFTQVTFGPTKR